MFNWQDQSMFVIIQIHLLGQPKSDRREFIAAGQP